MIRNFLNDPAGYYLLHPINFLNDLRREVRDFIQRGSRGYADSDLWSLDYYLASWMPTALQTYLDVGCTPGQFVFKEERTSDRYKEAGKKLWKRIIRKMQLGFLAHKKLSEEIIYGEDEVQKIINQKRRGLGLFAKYMHHLWY